MEAEDYSGVLSQTLTSSPCIKQILSARVRTPYHNDVVMVGHSSIHLPDLELGTQILSAKVISAEAQVISVSDPILDNGKDEIQFLINGQPCDASHPPQIVVLSTALSELVFVYARLLTNGSSQFVHARRHILGGRYWPRKYGKQLAIDSDSRALAVASMKGSFGLLALKNLEEIKSSIDEWDPRDPSSILPITEQIFVQVDGVILRMDFLKSPSAEPRRVVLLLIVANQGVSRLLLYRWDSWQSLTTTKPLKCSGYALPAEDAFPHLLIPSCKLLSFAIVTGHKLVFYDDITSSKKTKRVFNIPTPDDQKDKQWVQWAKAVRHEEHRKQKEDIFLIREDGLLKTTIVTHNSIQRSHITFEPGHLHIRVDTAVCALSAPPTKGGDVLIACGDTTEGGVFHLMARTPPVNVQSLANWSPITDLVHLEQTDYRSPGTQARLLATTGMHDGRAQLAQLRHGIEAQIVDAIEFEDAATADVLWIVSQEGQGRQLLLTSHHEHTNIVCHEPAIDAFSIRGPETYPQLGFDAPTLAACNINPDTILQITTTRVHLLGLSNQDHSDPGSLSGNFVCADAHPGTGAFIIASRADQNVQLIGGFVTQHPDNNTEILPLPRFHLIDYLPVSLMVTDQGGRTVLMVGSQDGRLCLYDIDSEYGISACATWDISSFSLDVDQPKISSVAMLAFADAEVILVVCGLKTGQVMMLDLTLSVTDDSKCASLSLSQSQSIGVTAVSISVEPGTFTDAERSAYLTCGSSLFWVHLFRNASGLDYTMDPLLVTATHPDHESYLLSSFNAVARIEQSGSDPNSTIRGLMVGITDKALLLLRLGQTAMVPTQVCQIKPTRHLVHSVYLQKCIISVEGSNISHNIGSKQEVIGRPSLQMRNYRISDPYEHEPEEASQVYFGAEGERIRALLRWAPTNGSTHYEMVVIGSDLNGDGRLSYITAKRLSQGKPGASATTFITYARKSISAICEYGLSSLLVCAGRELKLVHLDLSTKPPRWEHQAEIELPSCATEMRTKGSVVYIATSSHSYMLIREHDRRFQVIGSDNWAGKARNILPYGHSSTLVNLVSDYGSRILNFVERPTRGTKPTFEATVPEAVDKLVNIKSSTSVDARARFIGTTIDGTVYLFTTLNQHEMRLLAFLEQLCQPTRDQATKNASILAHRIVHQYANKLESLGVATPSFGGTHARGDLLKTLLAPGPYNIYFLLRKRIKLEEETSIKQEDELQSLRDVAFPVLGPTKAVVESVILWLRRLLNVPVF